MDREKVFFFFNFFYGFDHFTNTNLVGFGVLCQSAGEYVLKRKKSRHLVEHPRRGHPEPEPTGRGCMGRLSDQQVSGEADSDSLCFHKLTKAHGNVIARVLTLTTWVERTEATCSNCLEFFGMSLGGENSSGTSSK